MNRYSRYLPNIIIEKVVGADATDASASAELIQAAAMFADISGFTALTERLAAEGPAGAEKLTAILNGYFSQLITLVRDHGGDVVKFAGDALLALWRVRDDHESIEEMAWRAAQCGLEIQTLLRDYEAEGAALTLRVAIGAGPVIIAHVGGELNRWEFIISGKPLDQVGLVSDLIEPGETGVSPELWQLLRDNPQVAAQTTYESDKVIKLASVAATPAVCTLPPQNLTDAQTNALKKYLPGAIVQRLAGANDDYLAELRRLTILFVNLPELRYYATIEQAQSVMATLQRCCYHFEGSINKLSVDDKGVSLLAAFGLPPLSHEDDPDRGVKCALMMQRELKAEGWSSAIGVTTGRVYCGAVGSEFRREYTIMGDSVNLAARLMTKATQSVLCDQDTRDQVSPEVTFDAPFGIPLKGKALPVTAWRPLGVSSTPAGNAQRRVIVGRESERAVFKDLLATLRDGGTTHPVIVEADSGLGKTLLSEDLRDQVAASDIALRFGCCDAIEHTTSYFVWGQLLGDLVPGTRGTESDALGAARQILETAGMAELLPLLDDLVPVGLEDNALTSQMSGQVRADNTRDVVRCLLEGLADGKPSVIMIDDAHWMDSASWALLEALSQSLSGLLIALFTRPMEQRDPHFSLIAEKATMLALKPLTEAQIKELVCKALQTSDLPEEAAQMIIQRAEGHPYFSQQLALALRDSGVLEVTGSGQCRMHKGAADSVDLPHSIEGVITSRIDRLTATQAMVVKVASVIGRTFALDALRGIYPGEAPPTLLEDLSRLNDLDLTQRERAATTPGYAFRQIMTQQVAYGLMLHDQRRQLHEKIASWYEDNHKDLIHHYALLAHHWSHAGVAGKAMNYFEWAAHEALAVHANSEGASLLQQALDLATTHPVSAVRKGAWLRRLGSAQRNLAQLDTAADTLQLALRSLGSPMPSSKPGLIGQILFEALKQTWRSFRPTRRKALAQDEQVRRLEAAECMELLNIIYYWRSDKLRLLFVCLKGANLAASTGTRPRVLTRIYANLGLITGVVPLRRAARYYCKIAIKQARSDEHPPTLAWVLLLVATYRTGIGQLAEAEIQYTEGMGIARRLGDERQWGTLAASRNVNYLMRGMLDSALVSSVELAASGIDNRDEQVAAWGLSGQARVHLRRNNMTQMAELADAALTYISGCTLANQIDLFSLQALAALHAGDDELACRQVKEAASRLHNPSQVQLYAPCGQLVLAAVEAQRRRPDDPELEAAVSGALRFASGYARFFPAGEPAREFLTGLVHWHRKQPADAVKCWQQALADAEKMQMPYELALSCAALQRSGNAHQVERLAEREAAALKTLGTDSVGLPYQFDAAP